MKKWQLFAMAISIGTGSVGCDTLVSSELVNEVKEKVETLAKPAEDAPEELSINDLNQELGITEETDEQITGASSNSSVSLSNKDVSSGWKFGTYLFKGTSSSDRKVNLDYRTVSNGPVYAHAWYYKSGWKVIGWQYNRSNHRSYQGSFDIPSGSLAVYVGFFSSKGGKVTANMSLSSSTSNSNTGSNTSTGNTSNSDSNKFNDAISRAGGKLGSRKGEITSAESINGKKQEFSNGIVLLKPGASKAYAIYGEIYQKWLNSGNTSKYGAPVSDITQGRTINGKSSTYQLYDKQGDPSLHAWSGGVFHFNGGIREEWNRNGNYDKLGHPTSDERDASQTFEKGSITWSNGRANVYVGGNQTAVSQGTRSADYKERWRTFDSGSDPVSTPELKGGNASHKLSPAELIYYTSKENNINPVLLLGKLQDEQSLIKQGRDFTAEKDTKPDFEWRLARACGYGQADRGDDPQYYGFYPQLVGTTYQFALSRNKGFSFKQAYQSFTSGEGKYNNFVTMLYPSFASQMNQIAQTSYSTHPGNGYYNDFREISVSHIQRFLDSYGGALKEKDLFRQRPENSAKVQYP